jgi:hypothetical protein
MPQAQPAYATGVSWPSPPSRLPASWPDVYRARLAELGAQLGGLCPA